MKKDKLIVRITSAAVIIFIIGIVIINDYWEQKVMGSEKLRTDHEEREEIASEDEEEINGFAADKASENIVKPMINEIEEEIAQDVEGSTVELTEDSTIEDHRVTNPKETPNNTQPREAAQPVPVPSPAPSPVPESEPISKPVTSPEEPTAQIPEPEPIPEENPTPDPIPEVDSKPEVDPVPEITPNPGTEPISEP